MSTPEFRFYYHTEDYEKTILFYKDLLSLEILNTWDRSDTDKGTIFHSPNGTGLIEIVKGNEKPLLGGALYIEVEDPDHWYEIVSEKGIKILQPLSDTYYGHRSFKFEDPNGMTIGLFRYIKTKTIIQ